MTQTTVVNGAVRTMAGTKAEAVAIEDGAIVLVGTNAEVLEWGQGSAEVIDAGGASVLPGFIDAHNHVRLGGDSAAIQLFGATSLEEIHAIISAYLDEHPDVEWIEAEGWNYAAVPGGRPTASMLDPATRGKPAWIFSYDVHTVWLNTEGMRRWGLGRGMTELPFGRPEFDETGEPTGWVHDFATMGIHPRGQAALEAVLPGYALDAQYEQLVSNLSMAARFGLTTVVEPQNGMADIALFERAHREGELRSRLVAALIHTPESEPGSLDEIDAFIRDYRHDRISVGPIKLYIDDVIEPHTAAMLEPYANHPGRGSLFWSPPDFVDVLSDLDRRGLQAFIHATGDRGIRVALDAIETSAARVGPGDRRHQIVHVECLHADDIGRFASLGVVPCIQPRHCAPDIVTEWRENVGPARERYAWAMRSLMDSGARVAFSSDYNVAEMDPMVGLFTALTRSDLSGRDAWNTKETITLDEALAAYTEGSAWANFLDNRRGRLQPGFQADLVVLDRNLDDLGDPGELLATSVARTIVAGEVVYEA